MATVTINYTNRLPLRMDSDRIESYRIGDADPRGFGGRYLKRYPATAGGYHYWYRWVNPCTDGASRNYYLCRGDVPTLPEVMEYEFLDARELVEAAVAAGWQQAELA